MDLVHEEDRLLPVHTDGILGVLYDLFHIFFPGYSRIDLLEPGTCRVCDHFRQSRLSRSRRTVKDHGSKLIRLDRAVEELVLPDNMFLPDHLVQSRRTHPGC